MGMSRKTNSYYTSSPKGEPTEEDILNSRKEKYERKSMKIEVDDEPGKTQGCTPESTGNGTPRGSLGIKIFGNCNLVILHVKLSLLAIYQSS